MILGERWKFEKLYSEENQKKNRHLISVYKYSVLKFSMAY